ncbi:MAG TPA: Ig-like domain-containing protein [Verrucomicrobiae bacterium]
MVVLISVAAGYSARAANAQPTVAITNPVSNAVFTLPGIIPLRATAADSDGFVVDVKFYVYGDYLGVATNAPYAFDWKNVALGTYCVTAVATDNEGAKRTSAQLCFTITNNPAHNPKYILTDLGTLGGRDSHAHGINDLGVITGSSETTNFLPHPFVYTNGAMKDLVTDRTEQGTGLGINTAGRVTGYFNRPQNYYHATVWLGTNRTDLGMLGGNYSLARGINSSGQVAGHADISTGNTYEHAFLFSDGLMRDLGTLGGVESFAYAINDSGQVTGSSSLTNVGSRAFIYDTNNGLRALGTLGGIHSQGRAINELGHVAGNSEIPTGETHAFWYHDGVMEDLFVPFNTSTSQALGMNETGQIVGICDSSSSSSSRAFFWQNSVIYNLNSTITNTDWVLQSADAINERGQIVGYGEKGGVAYRRAYLLTPDAPPSVTFVIPANNAFYFGPTNITVGALAADLESGVRKVEFFANGLLIATDTNAPFSQVWSNVPGGTYTLTAVATDNRDLVRTSAPVSITVAIPNQPPTFLPGPDQILLEDSGAQTIANWASAISAGPTNEAGQVLTFVVTNNNPGLFLVAPAIDSAGTLAFTPTPNAFGTSVVTVVLRDDGGMADGGNDTSAPQTFEIRILAVNDPPVANAGPNQILPCAGALTSVLLDGSASEDAEGDVLTFAWREGNTLLGTNQQQTVSLSVGSHIIALEVTDSGGSSSLDALVVTITDVTPPIITCAADRIVESGQPWNFDPPTVVDLCGGTNVTITVVGTATNSVLACTFTATRTWRATDASGNQSTCTQTIRVRDTVSPALLCPSNIVVEATNAAGAVATFTTSSTDNCASGVTMFCAPPSGSSFPIGTSSVTCSIADASGNSNSCSFSVIVRGPRGIKENVLTELMTLSAGGAGAGQKQLDKAIGALVSATDAAAWIDDNHLVSKSGSRIFNLEKSAVQKLGNLVKDQRDSIPDELLLNWIARLVNADRLLTQISVGEAASDGSPAQKIAEARELIAKADADAADGRPTSAIARYRTAWKRSIELQTRGGL